MEKKLCTVIIPHHNAHDHLKNCLACIDNTLFDIIICSGNSFGHNCNKGVKIAETDKLIFLNDDTLPTNKQLSQICEFLNDYDLIGSTQVVQGNKRYYGIGIVQLADGKYTHRIQLQPGNSLFPSGFCFGIKKKEWEKIGGFDERFRTGNEDVDFGFKAIKLGFSMRMLNLDIIHLESQSEGRFKYIKENEDLINQVYSQDDFKKIYETAKKII